VELVWQPYNLKSDYTRDCICQRGPKTMDDRRNAEVGWIISCLAGLGTWHTKELAGQALQPREKQSTRA
jgi:hypothetical protein